jgi:hypothetical protein
MSSYDQMKALAKADPVGQFEFEHAGYRCFVIRRNSMAIWCGYVLLPDDHPWTKQEDVSADVHGGVTWNRNAPKHLDDVQGWLVGFDTAHYGDFNPSMLLRDNSGSVWRDKAYVEAECRRLAEQAREAAAETES